MIETTKGGTDDMNLKTWLSAALLAVMMIGGSAVAGAPKAQIDPRWQRSGNGLAVDYGGLNAFLKRYGSTVPDGRTVIAYGRVTPADKAALSATIDRLEAVDVDALTRRQQFAYWINLYNAATIEIVLKAYPVSSILYIRDGLLPFGPWDRKVLMVKGRSLNLNEVEHRILRPIFGDARVHFAINCASYGCPNIALSAYEAATLDAQLDTAARGYINDPRGFRAKGKRLIASRIFDWYGVDFGGPAGVLTFARRFATPRTAALLAGRSTIDGYEYDWSLNEAR